MGFRDDSEAMRARADALERENRELRRRLEALQHPEAPERPAPQPGRYSGVWIAGGIAVLALGAGLVTTGRVPLVVALVFAAVAVLLITVGVTFGLLHVAGPDEALVISGRQHRRPDGQAVGYRIVTGGRVVTLPLIEKVDRISLRAVPVPIKVTSAYTKKGGIVDLEAAGLVKISSDPTLLPNAVERFLGRSLDEVALVARETIEGHMRSVLATLTMEEIEEDRLKVADVLLRETDSDMDRLGLTLDTLKIQRVQRS